MAHKGSYKMATPYSEGDGPSAYTSLSAYNKMTSYSEVVKQLRDPDFDLSLNPMDAEALMISGGGKSHGTVAMCDGFVPITETLSQIKARQTSSAPVIRQRPRPVDLAIEVSFLHYFFSSFDPGWMMMRSGCRPHLRRRGRPPDSCCRRGTGIHRDCWRRRGHTIMPMRRPCTNSLR